MAIGQGLYYEWQNMRKKWMDKIIGDRKLNMGGKNL